VACPGGPPALRRRAGGPPASLGGGADALAGEREGEEASRHLRWGSCTATVGPDSRGAREPGRSGWRSPARTRASRSRAAPRRPGRRRADREGAPVPSSTPPPTPATGNVACAAFPRSRSPGRAGAASGPSAPPAARERRGPAGARTPLPGPGTACSSSWAAAATAAATGSTGGPCSCWAPGTTLGARPYPGCPPPTPRSTGRAPHGSCRPACCTAPATAPSSCPCPMTSASWRSPIGSSRGGRAGPAAAPARRGEAPEQGARSGGTGKPRRRPSDGPTGPPGGAGRARVRRAELVEQGRRGVDGVAADVAQDVRSGTGRARLPSQQETQHHADESTRRQSESTASCAGPSSRFLVPSSAMLGPPCPVVVEPMHHRSWSGRGRAGTVVVDRRAGGWCRTRRRRPTTRWGAVVGVGRRRRRGLSGRSVRGSARRRSPRGTAPPSPRR